MQWKRMSARDCPLLTKEVTYKKKGGKSKNKYFLFDKVCVRIERREQTQYHYFTSISVRPFNFQFS